MKKLAFKLAILTLAIMMTYACKDSSDSKTAYQGIQLENMDTTQTPNNDFYNYVNGTWMNNTEIPADRERWGSFDELRKMTNEKVLSILEKTMDNMEYPKSSDQYKAVAFYQSGLDSVSLNEKGVEPLQPFLAAFEKINNTQDLQKVMEEMSPYGASGFFSLGVNADLKDSKMNAAYMGSGSLGLPDRDYYTNEDEESVEIRKKYLDHIAKMFEFVGVDAEEGRAKAEKILNLETRMAQPMLTKTQRRNPYLMYNKKSTADLDKMVPQVNWTSFLENIGIGNVDTLIVTEPKYMEVLGEILAEGNVQTWKDYLMWDAINSAAPYLSDDIAAQDFDFYSKELRGVTEQKPRWETVLQNTNGVLGEALGKLYVDEYFPPEAKVSCEKMVNNIKVAFGERIKNLDWMSEATKEKALEKLSTFTVKIAYPDEWKDYSELDVQAPEDGGSYLQNLLNASAWNYKKALAKIGKEVDKSEWFMPPQIVNAYYNPLYNEIVFPAAILQPPFFNFEADDAVNYGGIGAVIGHEISHGFDDSGSRFDAEGNMNNWWTDEDKTRFEEKCAGLIAQFDKFEPLPGVFVNGEFTQGENIGDLGGINAAYDGLLRSFEDGGRPELIDGFTPEQRFFLSWGTIWRTKYRDDALKTQIKTDPHSPGYYRAIGPLTNVDAFYEAFDVKEADAMYTPDSLRIKIW